jgi:hypothetical protein
VHEVDAAERGPPPQARIDRRIGEPRSEESGFLGTLSRTENGEHG